MNSSTASIQQTNFTYVTTGNYDDDVHDYQKEELNLFYAICEVLVAILAVVGNALVILVFRKERRLRRRTNYYIVSLAVADFLVGLLGIPFAIMASVGLPTNLYACLFTVSLLVVLCTISIFCLVAVSVDRYWAILHPMGYSRNVRTKTALVIISICWFAGTVVGFLPLMGWHKGPAENGRCFFLGVMDYNYLVFLYFGTIITPALLLAVFYAHIYHVVLRQLRQIVTINPEKGKSSNGRTTGGTMLRMLGAAQKREVKATQNLSIIVLFFMICWIPLYTINCILAFCKDCKINSTFMLFCIILSHLNSAGNPLLYAYHLKDFRAALKQFICGLFGYGPAPPPPNVNYGINNNFTHYRLQSLREARSAMSLSRSKFICESQFGYGKPRSHTLPTPPKMASLVSNSVALAAATAEANRDIWRISEISDELKDDTIRLRRSLSECSNRYNSVAFMDDFDEDDDVFLTDIIQTTDVNCEPSHRTSDLVIPSLQIQTNNLNISTSSPQLSRSNIFLVETELKGYFNKSVSTDKAESNTTNEFTNNTNSLSVSGDFIHSPAKTLKLSPFKVMGELLKSTNKQPPPRSSSLSDDPYVNDAVRHRNGYVPENHSFGC